MWSSLGRCFVWPQRGTIHKPLQENLEKCNWLTVPNCCTFKSVSKFTPRLLPPQVAPSQWLSTVGQLPLLTWTLQAGGLCSGLPMGLTETFSEQHCSQGSSFPLSIHMCQTGRLSPPTAAPSLPFILHAILASASWKPQFSWVNFKDVLVLFNNS